MLSACVNVASLLLVRANERQREMSVRAALGATRGRIIRQLLTENILVALIGGAAGVVLAQWALDFIGASVPQGRPSLIAAGGTGLARLSHLDLDGGVLAFALGLTITTALVFGLAPAWLSSSANLNEALKQGTRGSTEGRARGRFRATLVVIEIAMAVTLLACSGLLIRSFLRTAAYQTGFNPKGTALVRLPLEGKNYEEPEQRFAFINSLLARIEGAAGVEAVGTINHFPLSGIRPAAGFEIEGGPAMAITERPLAQFLSVSPDYFRAMGIPLIQGRYFSEYDGTNSRRLAIINQTFARQHFPNQDPIGKRILVTDPFDRRCEIVGVVGDVAQEEVGEVPSAQLYESHAETGNSVVVVIRGRGDPAALPAIVTKAVHALDPDLPVADRRTVEVFLRDKVMIRRLMTQLLTVFAVIGLFIAAIGIYGVMAFSVNQRTVEIGIRMALGAQTQDVLRLVLRQGARLVGIGFMVGIAATFIAGRALESHLYNTSGQDPVSLLAITVFFAGVAALACWLPARRATKVDPIVALRAE
jgi:putative ABC transport system permease protein